MTPEVERFLDLATRPLEAKPNERDEAKGELMSRIGHSGVPYEMLDLSEPLERLTAAKPAKHALRRTLLLAGSLLLLAAAATATALLIWQIFLMVQANAIATQSRYQGSIHYDSEDMQVVDYVRSLAPSLPLGLDETRGAGEAAKLFEKHPDDLPIFQEQVVRRLREADNRIELTDEEKKTIARLDPDNALWPLIQITPSLTKAVGSSPTRYSYRSTGATITSEPDFQEALRLFSEAANKTAYIDHGSSLMRRQLDAFPPARSLHESEIAAEFSRLASQPFTYNSGNLGSLANLHCDRLVAASDSEGLSKFYREWKQLSTLVLRSPQSGDYDYSDIFHQLEDVGRKLDESIVKLGMVAEKVSIDERRQILNNVINNAPPPEVQKAYGARLKSEDRLPSNLTMEEVVSTRRVELSFLDRIVSSIIACLALIFTGLVAFETCRRARTIKGMARGLTPLFQKEDHVWIAVLGLAVPWLWWWIITRMSPLGWRDGDLDEPWAMMVWLLQACSGLTLAAVMLLQTARWRWNVRGGFLGLGGSLPWIGWGVAALTALSIPVAGSFRYFEHSMGSNGEEMFMLGVAGMAACGLLWLLWHGIMTLFTPRSGALRPNLTMRAVLPWTMTGVATLLVSFAISTAMERHWIAKDQLFPAWTSKTHVNVLKERVAKEIPEVLRGQ